MADNEKESRKTADEIVVEQRCAPVDAKMENDLRVVAKINNRTCKEELQISIEEHVVRERLKQDCANGMIKNERLCKTVTNPEVI